MSKVELHPHNPDWARLASLEASRFSAVVGGVVVKIHHIGSTSIPGIRAKPIFDLLPEVASLEALDALQDQVTEAGYEWRGEYGLPGRRFCPRLDPNTGERLANIHCYQQGDAEIVRHLAFRDYLRAHPAVAAAYEADKLRCQRLHPDDVFQYTDAKDAFIKATQREALEWMATRISHVFQQPGLL